MSDFVLSGGCRWNDTCVADVTMDAATGDPLTCCNPITGVCLGGGGGGNTAKLTVIVSNENASGTITAPHIEENPILGKTLATTIPASVSTGTKVIEILLGEDGADVVIDAEEVTSYEGDIELDGLEGIITGDATITIVGYGNE